MEKIILLGVTTNILEEITKKLASGKAPQKGKSNWATEAQRAKVGWWRRGQRLSKENRKYQRKVFVCLINLCPALDLILPLFFFSCRFRILYYTLFPNRCSVIPNTDRVTLADWKIKNQCEISGHKQRRYTRAESQVISKKI